MTFFKSASYRVELFAVVLQSYQSSLRRQFARSNRRKGVAGNEKDEEQEGGEHEVRRRSWMVMWMSLKEFLDDSDLWIHLLLELMRPASECRCFCCYCCGHCWAVPTGSSRTVGSRCAEYPASPLPGN